MDQTGFGSSFDFTGLASEWDPFPILNDMRAMSEQAQMNPALAGGGEVGSGYPASAPGAPAAAAPGLAPIGPMQSMLQPGPQVHAAPGAAPRQPQPINLPGLPMPKRVPSLAEILNGRQ